MPMTIDSTNFNPLPDKADNALIPYSVFDELDEPAMLYGIEELADVQIQHPV
mgnify:CR=1 FL=1